MRAYTYAYKALAPSANPIANICKRTINLKI